MNEKRKMIGKEEGGQDAKGGREGGVWKRSTAETKAQGIGGGEVLYTNTRSKTPHFIHSWGGLKRAISTARR